jgi:hypothetical protein
LNYKKRNTNAAAIFPNAGADEKPGIFFTWPYIVVNGLYIPRNQKFAVSRQFYFCADPRCIAIKPFASNIQTPTI